jgi:hypothetical protein
VNVFPSGVLVAMHKTVTMLNGDLQERATFDIPEPFAHMREAYGEQVVTVAEGSSTLRVWDLATFQISRDICLADDETFCIANWPDKPMTIVGTSSDRIYVVDLRVDLPVSSWNFRNARVVVPVGAGLGHAAIAQGSAQIYDHLTDSVSLTVNGKTNIVLSYGDKLLMMGQSGTFFVDPRGRHKVRGLFDTRVYSAVPRRKDHSYELPDAYQQSLHSHMFQITSACVDDSGMCASADCAGYFHLWSPRKLRGSLRASI